MKALTILILSAVAASAATVKISDLPLKATTSTNTFIEVADMNAATKSGKYLLTNLATQAALDLKAPIASPTFTGTVTAPALNVTGEISADSLAVYGLAPGWVELDANTNLVNIASPYAAVTNALSFTGETDKFLRADGTLAAAGGATNVTDFSATQAAFTNILASSVNTAAASIKISPRKFESLMGSVSFESPETATVGNARGSGAVDLQVGRNSAAKVASGVNSFAAGTNNTASGASAVSLGEGNSVSGTYGFSAGNANVASGYNAVALGQYASSSLYSQLSLASGMFAAAGDAQTSTVVLRRTSSGNTPAVLYLNGSTTPLALPANTTWAFRILIAARGTDAGTGDEESAGYQITGLIERDNSAAATRIVGTPAETILAEDDAAWTVALSADTTNGALSITVTGNNETTVRWVATVVLTQVGG